MTGPTRRALSPAAAALLSAVQWGALDGRVALDRCPRRDFDEFARRLAVWSVAERAVAAAPPLPLA